MSGNAENQKERLKIYRVKRYDFGHNEYAAFVCSAKSEKCARERHPTGYLHWEYSEHEGGMCWVYKGLPDYNHAWTVELDKLDVECIGIASEPFPTVFLVDFFEGRE